MFLLVWIPQHDLHQNICRVKLDIVVNLLTEFYKFEKTKDVFGDD